MRMQKTATSNIFGPNILARPLSRDPSFRGNSEQGDSQLSRNDSESPWLWRHTRIQRLTSIRAGYRTQSGEQACDGGNLFRKSRNIASHRTQISSASLAIPARHRGAFRDRHERRAGDAVDAGGAADESAYLRTANSCGPDASMVGVKLRRSVCEVTVTTKPDHRGEREGNR
jgi:hypothetical protein